MRLGFVIDQDRCIGCHACTVACKEEHDVPLGVFRTWVKYIEKGEFPDTRRHFGVMRCNHCDDAPCVEICPTTALFHRDNGIVDFDNARCIGCKSCMQACPYDALYIEPESHTAAKCNFCAHRVERNLEPACVIVCPTQAIIAGDLDNPSTRIAQTVATGKVVSRKPHKATNPKLFYVGIDGDLLNPTAPTVGDSYSWAERHDAAEARDLPPGYRRHELPGAPRVVYNVAHPAPWGWKIGAYLFTKSIAAGAILVAALMFALGYRSDRALIGIAAPLLAMVFAGITGVLLIADLKRPDRFYFLFTKPNPRSWVVIGAWILLAYGGVAFAWFALAIPSGAPPPAIAEVGAVLAVGAACYTGFLFAQAKGRDLWQSPLFTWHLLVQAVVAGASALILVSIAIGATPSVASALGNTLAIALAVSLAMIMGEVHATPVSDDVKLAAETMTVGALRTRLRAGVLGAGITVPAGMIVLAAHSDAGGVLSFGAAVLALAGVWMFEAIWVRAGQMVPLS